VKRLNSPSSKPDTALRAITDDGAFRVIAVRTTETVRGAIAAQKTEGESARLFADLLTGTILIRETMSPDLRVQAILQGDDRHSRMIADAHPDSTTRGIVHLAPGLVPTAPIVPSKLGQKAVLQVARTLHNGAIHQGVVSMPDNGAISGALMAYMQDSEQVVSIVAVGSILGDDGLVKAAGGYILQLLPEVGEGPLMVMTERMKDFVAMQPLLERGAADPEELLTEILYGMPFSKVGESSLSFGCNCSTTRVTASLATLPRSEIQEFITDGRLLEIGCDYCGAQYQIPPEALRGLLEAH
jgi:molecular chaperone Hsp33